MSLISLQGICKEAHHSQESKEKDNASLCFSTISNLSLFLVLKLR